jgi:hypothetical protein
MNLPPEDPAETTGLPGLRTWRRVYLVVFAVFLLWVGLLTLLTELYA